MLKMLEEQPIDVKIEKDVDSAFAGDVETTTENAYVDFEVKMEDFDDTVELYDAIVIKEEVEESVKPQSENLNETKISTPEVTGKEPTKKTNAATSHQKKRNAVEEMAEDHQEHQLDFVHLLEKYTILLDKRMTPAIKTQKNFALKELTKEYNNNSNQNLKPKQVLKKIHNMKNKVTKICDVKRMGNKRIKFNEWQRKLLSMWKTNMDTPILNPDTVTAGTSKDHFEDVRNETVSSNEKIVDLEETCGNSGKKAIEKLQKELLFTQIKAAKYKEAAAKAAETAAKATATAVTVPTNAREEKSIENLQKELLFTQIKAAKSQEAAAKATETAAIAITHAAVAVEQFVDLYFRRNI